MTRPSLKNLAVLATAALLAALGVYNIVLKATFTLMDDGVFWAQAPEGVVAGRVAEGSPGAMAGIQPGDVLVALDGHEILRAAQIEERLAQRQAGDSVRYTLLRADARQALELSLRPLAQGNVTLFYYLSLVGFFSLAVGTSVMLRRRPDATTLHFYAICLLFFLMYSTSYTGKLNWADWTLLWTDHLAILFLPVVFLHFCLSFPERRLPAVRAWLIPLAYLPALLVTGAAAASQALYVALSGMPLLWQITAAIDHWKTLYLAGLFALSFAVLLDSYRQTKSLTTRKQMKWLMWGTGTGVMPFFLFYAIPFTFGREPSLAGELLGNVPLALIPLALAYAVVKHRLMDVELIFRRTLVSFLAMVAVVGVCLLVVGLFGSLVKGDEEPHSLLIAALSTFVVVLLFTPLKQRFQDLSDRLFYRERYDSRKALLRLSQDLNVGLDLARLTERLQQGVVAALGVGSVAVFLPDESQRAFAVFAATGLGPQGPQALLPSDGPLLRRLAAGAHVDAEAGGEAYPEAGPLDLSYYFPCRVRGEVIAVLGVGRREGLEPLNSEEVDLVQALAGQAATAIMNGRLYQSLREKADALERLTDYNENILESIDSGILVLDLDGRVARWNRALESLYGRRRGEVLGRPLAEVFPETFMEALRNSLVLGDREEIAHMYKLHLPTPQGRSLTVNVAIAPFQLDSGERHGSILIFEDVTARARLEEQLQHAEKMASIGLLAAGVAHEVNTPLTGVSSYTQLLREQIKPEDLRYPLLEKIEKQTFRAAKIVNSLLNFARSGGAEMEALDVNKLLFDALSLVEHQLEKARVKVRREFADELPAVRGNENRLQQVFFNLILNAKDAMPSGGWLTLVTRSDDADTVVVEVSDTGVGIKREDIKRIYDPFFTTKGMGRGTGLGLSVSYGIVQEHGGAIFVDSAPGKGTCFQVALPACALAEAARR